MRNHLRVALVAAASIAITVILFTASGTFAEPSASVSSLLSMSFSSSSPTSSIARATLRDRLSIAVAPLEARPAVDEKLIVLGRALYTDPHLSKNGQVSCQSCHPLESGGTTSEPLTARGVNGALASFNTPTIFNAPRGTRQGVRADAADIPEILERPLFKDNCMANRDWDTLLARVNGDKKLVSRFDDAGVVVGREGMNEAIVAYLQAIEPRNAPLDKFLRGDERALAEDALRGAALFETIGCVSCHTGAGLGGDRVMRFGMQVTNPYADRGQCADDSFCRSDADCGGGGADTCRKTGKVRDVDLGAPVPPGEKPSYKFRVPSLRNVALTGPYFHDGSARTLDEAVRTMARLQLGRTLTADESKELVAFLTSLTGELPPNELKLAMAASKASAAKPAQRAGQGQVH